MYGIVRVSNQSKLDLTLIQLLKARKIKVLSLKLAQNKLSGVFCECSPISCMRMRIGAFSVKDAHKRTQQMFEGYVYMNEENITRTHSVLNEFVLLGRVIQIIDESVVNFQFIKCRGEIL